MGKFFCDTLLDVPWLASRAPVIQYSFFATKLEHFLTGGQAPSDMAALVAHYRAREDEPGFAPFKWLLLNSDLLAGRIAAARRKIDALAGEMVDTPEPSRLLILGSVVLERISDGSVCEDCWRLAPPHM